MHTRHHRRGKQAHRQHERPHGPQQKKVRRAKTLFIGHRWVHGLSSVRGHRVGCFRYPVRIGRREKILTGSNGSASHGNPVATAQIAAARFEYKEKGRSLPGSMSTFDALIGRGRGELSSNDQDFFLTAAWLCPRSFARSISGDSEMGGARRAPVSASILTPGSLCVPPVCRFFPLSCPATSPGAEYRFAIILQVWHCHRLIVFRGPWVSRERA